jgi:hypothetical protein
MKNLTFFHHCLAVAVCVFVIVLLTGCSTAVPIKQKFPEADPFMFEAAPTLEVLPSDTVDLDKLLSNSTENYGKYRELVKRYEMWKEWYIKQKENFDGAYK